MANAIPFPWICDYLIDVAETYGANLSSVIPHDKTKKAQLIRFITHQKPEEDTWVWATVSDKVHSIPVRFSKEAVERYKRDPLKSHESFTDLKTAFIQVKAFRPMLTRVPLGTREGMSSTSRLALDVQDFDVKGSFGAECWGSPVDAETDERIRAWTEGLRSDGGGGNILMARKQERVALAQDSATGNVLKARSAHTRRTNPNIEQREIKKITSTSSREYSLREARGKGPRGRDDSRIYKQTWRRVSRNPYQHIPNTPHKLYETLESASFAKDSDVDDHALPPPTPRDQDSAVNEDILQHSTPLKQARRHILSPAAVSCPHTPSNWSVSGYGDEAVPTPPGSSSSLPAERDDSFKTGSPMQVDTARDIAEAHTITNPPNSVPQHSSGQDAVDNHVQVDASRLLSSSLPTPTPAQRVRQASPPSFLQPPEIAHVLIPSSSLPLANVPTSSAASFRHQQKQAIRQAAFPQAAHRSIHPDISAPGRILVPNSDTSVTASLSQPSQPQSQSQSQSLSHNSQSQSQFPQRYAQSLSYSPKSQKSQSQPDEQAQPREEIVNIQSSESQTKSEPCSQGHSQLRNEILPPSDPPEPDHASTIAEPDGPEAVVPSGDQAQDSLDYTDHRPSQEDRPRSPVAASAERHEPGEHEQAVEPLPAPPAITQDLWILDSFATVTPSQSHDADDEAEPYTLASIDSVSFDDQGAEPSDDEEDELDSDDPRTDTMFQTHISPEPELKTSRERSSLSSANVNLRKSPSPDVVPDSQPEAMAIDESGISIKPTRGHDADAPAMPSSPDVFLSEASFRRDTSSRAASPHPPHSPEVHPTSNVDNEEPVPVPSTELLQEIVLPLTSNHDPEMWKAPTFLQQKSAIAEEQRPEPVLGVKRPLSPSSSSTQEERPKKKKRLPAEDTASETSPIHVVQRPIVKHVGAPAVVMCSDTKLSTGGVEKQDSAASVVSGVRHINLRRSGSTSSISSQPKSSKSTVPPPDGTSARARTPKVDVIMVRDARLSTGRPRELSFQELSVAKKPVHPKGTTKRPREVSRNPETVDPTTERSSNTHAAPSQPPQTSVFGASRARQSHIGDGREEGSSSSERPQREDPRPASPRAGATQTLLEGYQMNLDMVQENGLPPVTWGVLADILMRTGRARHKERVCKHKSG